MAFPGRWWHKPDPQDAFWLSWVSLICTLIGGIGGIVGYKKTESTLILAFGLENFVDFMSSIIVIWRFYAPFGCDEATLSRLEKREERASVAISIVIGILGLYIFGVAIYDFTNSDEDQDLSLLFTIAFVSVLVFGSLAIIKFKYARDLDSPSLYKDGICSAIGTVLSGSLLLTTAIIDYAPNAWFIDPVVSLIIGVSATVYGFRVVINMVRNGVPIFHPEWWITKREREGDIGAPIPEAKNQELPPRENVGLGSESGEQKNTGHEFI